jgi:hypothetical protein
MKVLLPTTSEQTISIIPRKTDSLDSIGMTIIMDGEKTEEVLSDLTVVENGNYLDVSFSSSILTEGSGYAIEMKQGDNLFYRDKFYVTSQQDYTVKHKESQLIYTEYNEADDNTFIIK